jgi:uncharacterized protein DUF2804
MRIPARGDALPWRGDGETRPPAEAGPMPPQRLPLVRGGRPRKRWRYVGVYGADLMLCAGLVSVGGLAQAFWAVWDRRAGVLRERTRLGPARGPGYALALPDGAVRIRDRGIAIDLALEPAGDAVEVVSRHGAQPIWTRKRPLAARGTVEAGGRVLTVDAPALLDDSAGWHARRTAWEWSAGAGRTPDGRAVAWSLVAGVHDGPVRSERTVWLDGVAHEAGPVRFAAALDTVGGLRFTAEAERRHRDRVAFGLLESEYRQPFGAFAGTLPGGIAIVHGRGVMERHRARW